MKIVGKDGNAVLVDMEREENGVPLGVVVRGTVVSPMLPMDRFTDFGLYDQDVKPGERDRVLQRVKDAKPALGVAL